MLHTVATRIQAIAPEFVTVDEFPAFTSDMFGYHPASISIEIEDFDGFDENWNEIMIDIDKDAEEQFLAQLRAMATEYHPGFYPEYVIDGIIVTLGYASYDI